MLDVLHICEYLAATKDVLRTVLASGPQDECAGSPEGTIFFTAFVHGDSSETYLEPALPIMEDNWMRMGVWPTPLAVHNGDDYV